MKIKQLKKLHVRFLLLWLCLGVTAVTALHLSAKEEEKLSGHYNELGNVLILEYHSIGLKEERWARSRENFQKDLERLYQANFRLVQVRDFFDRQHIDLPAGKKPLLLTFDDARLDQLKFQENEYGEIKRNSAGHPLIDPNCAVGILDAFYQKHPDFGRAATFYLNFPPFRQGDNEQVIGQEKLKYLLETGRDLGNHTTNHVKLSELNAKQIEKALAHAVKLTRQYLGDPTFTLTSLALPYGLFPASQNGKAALRRGAFEGIHYHHTNILLVGAGPASPPYVKSFDPTRIQRVQAIQSELDKWLDYYHRHPNEYYVSDGDPHTITIQLKDLAKLRKPKLLPGKILQQCDGKVVKKKETILSKSIKLQSKKTAERGVYLTYNSATSPLLDTILKRMEGTELNTLVIDITDPMAKAVIPFAKGEPRSVPDDHPTFKWLKDLTEKLHRRQLRISARIVVFLDNYLAKVRPDLMIQHRGASTPWRDRSGNAWADPYAEAVIQYKLFIAEAAARAGVDEVQFDYIRFPTDGSVHLAYYPHQQGSPSRKEVIENFLAPAEARLAPYHTSIAIDIFGVVAWQAEHDILTLGQDATMIANYVDVICPMLYASHFSNGYDGFSNPADHPDYFVGKGCQNLRTITAGEIVKIIPWLQGFPMKTSSYGPAYIAKQRTAALTHQSAGYLIWNAGNDYQIIWPAVSKNTS